MKKLSLLLLFYFCLSFAALAQSISNVTLSKNGNQIAYIKNGDSLFISDLPAKANERLVDEGLKENGNQRFLQWTPDSKLLIYEKKGSLKIFDTKGHASKIIPNDSIGTLKLFRWFLTRQTGLGTRNDLYFSAGVNKDPFQLFKLDTVGSELKQLTKSDTDAGNVSASPDGADIVFATYKYVDNKPESQLHILNTKNEAVVFDSANYQNTFFTEFKWSPNGLMLLAKVNGDVDKLFTFEPANHALHEAKLLLETGDKPNEFLDDSTFIFSRRDENNDRKIGLVNLINGTRKIVVNENSTFLGLTATSGKQQILYVTESRIRPKTIWQAELSNQDVLRHRKLRSFADKNPLAKFTYATYRYKNGGGGLSSSYIYFPKNYHRGDKKFPLLILPYGGYTDTYPDLGYFLYNNLFRYLNKGFIIAFPNTRGIQSEKQVTDYGKVQLDDTEKFINEIGPQFNVNNKKIFVLGHSHGGAMVFYYLTHSDIFAGGIAISGAADWIKQADKEAMAGLPFGMGGTPAELKEKYLEYSPLENIDKLKSPLLLFAGKKDTQIPYDINSEAFQKKAVANKKSVKFVLFEDEGHLIEKPKNRAVLWDEIDSFIKRLTQ